MNYVIRSIAAAVASSIAAVVVRGVMRKMQDRKEANPNESKPAAIKG